MKKYYHNPRCSKSRQGLSLLQEKGIEFEVIEYLKDVPSTDQLKDFYQKLGKSPAETVRRKEDAYKGLGSRVDSMNDEEWIETIRENPVLFERPALESDTKAVIGRPPEDLLTLL